jgi:hypothetical protein
MYSFIFAPPVLDERMSAAQFTFVRIAWLRLMVQVLGITALSSGAFVISQTEWWKTYIENKRLKRDLENLQLQSKINEIVEGSDEI